MMSEQWSTWTWLFLDFCHRFRLPKCQKEFDHGLAVPLSLALKTSKHVSSPSFLVTPHSPIPDDV